MAERDAGKLEEIRERLRSDNAEERRRAICDLPGGWVPGALDVLVSALADENWRVRKEAVGRVAGWPDADGAVAALVAVLRDEDDVGWRNAVVEALSRIGKPAVGALLSELDSAGGQHKFVVDILGAIGDESAVERLVALLSDPDANLRMAAAEALRDIGSASAQTALRSCLSSEDIQLRLAAVDGLAELSAAVPLAEIVPNLDRVILRKASLRLLGWSRDRRALDPLVEALIDTRRPMRVTAIVAAANLLEHLKARDEEAPRVACVLSEEALANVRAELSTPSVEARRGAAALLGCAQDAESVPRLAALLDDPDVGRVCAEAIAAIGSAATDGMVAAARAAEGEGRIAIFDLVGSARFGGAAVEEVLVEAVDDDDEEVAATAARTLGEVAGASNLAPVLSALRAALERLGAAEVASAAATAVGRLGSRGLAPDARRWLEQSIDAGEAEVRAASALALAALKDPGVVETLAAHLTDEDAYARLAAIRALATTGETGRTILSRRVTSETDAEMVDAIRKALDEEGGGGAS